MTPVQIAYFKHFLYDKGIERVYISMYRNKRITGGPEGDKKANPVLLEEFLRKTTVEDVLLKAFYFYPNSDYGFDYWNALNIQWKRYWAIHENNFSNDKYVLLNSTFSILRTNWDMPKPHIKESKEETYKRMGIEPPIKEEEEQKEEKTAASDSKHQPDKAPEPQTETINFFPEDDPLDGMEFLDEPTMSNTRLSSKEISVNFNSGSFKITFNTAASEHIKKSGVAFARIAKLKTGEYCLILNNDSGANIRFNGSGRSKKSNATVNSKELATKLSSALGINSVYTILHIELLPTTNNVVYKVSL